MRMLMCAILFLSMGTMMVHAEEAEPITYEVASCDTKEAMTEYTKRVFVGEQTWQDALKEVNKSSVVCRVAKTTFKVLEMEEAFSLNGVTYTLVKIQTMLIYVPVAPGISSVELFEGTRYVMVFART